MFGKASAKTAFCRLIGGEALAPFALGKLAVLLQRKQALQFRGSSFFHHTTSWPDRGLLYIEQCERQAR